MEITKIEEKINELVKEFSGAPRPNTVRIIPVGKKQTQNKPAKKTANSLQESLNYLRVCIKYQIFDIEATRRENKYLRKMLDSKKK